MGIVALPFPDNEREILSKNNKLIIQMSEFGVDKSNQLASESVPDVTQSTSDEHIAKKIKLEAENGSEKVAVPETVTVEGATAEGVNTPEKPLESKPEAPVIQQDHNEITEPSNETSADPIGQSVLVSNETIKETGEPVEAAQQVTSKETEEADKTTEEVKNDGPLIEEQAEKSEKGEISQSQMDIDEPEKEKANEAGELGETEKADADKTEDHADEKPSEAQETGEVQEVEGTKENGEANTEGTKETEGDTEVTNKKSDLEELKKFNTKEQVLEIIKLVFPNRRHLGSLVYNPTTTWLTLQTSQLTGLKDEHFERYEELKESYREKSQEEYYTNSIQYIPMIPPLPNDYINYYLEVKIPYRFIRMFKNELDEGIINRKREIWGGKYGIYTDDSDILTMLTHLGFFTNTVDLTEWNPSWKPQDIIYPQINVQDEIKGDLSVTLLLLPTLDVYEPTFNNGINSRPWKKLNRHDGLSIAVHSIKWEIEGSYLRDKSFFKRYQTEVAYDGKYLKQQVEGRGWEFDVKYYKSLKEKYEREEKEKKEKETEKEKVEEQKEEKEKEVKDEPKTNDTTPAPANIS